MSFQRAPWRFLLAEGIRNLSWGTNNVTKGLRCKRGRLANDTLRKTAQQSLRYRIGWNLQAIYLMESLQAAPPAKQSRETCPHSRQVTTVHKSPPEMSWRSNDDRALTSQCTNWSGVPWYFSCQFEIPMSSKSHDILAPTQTQAIVYVPSHFARRERSPAMYPNMIGAAPSDASYFRCRNWHPLIIINETFSLS